MPYKKTTQKKYGANPMKKGKRKAQNTTSSMKKKGKRAGRNG